MSSGASKSNPALAVLRRIFGVSEIGILFVLVLLIVLVSFVQPNFASVASLSNFGSRAAWFGIIGLGVVFQLSMGEIDLSTASIYGLTINVAAVVVVTFGIDPWVASALGIIVGVGLGALNAVMATAFKVPVIIITLGTLSAFKGLTLIVSGGGFIYGLPREHSFFKVMGATPLGVPMVIWAFGLLTVVLSVVYNHTRYGFMVRSIGSNPRAAELSGIPIARVRMITLMLTGALCGISGMLTLAFFSTADPNLGAGYELLAITAAIIGGTALTGGRGTVVGAALGALLIAVISSGIVQFGITANWSVFVTGVLIITAVALDAAIRRRRSR